MTSPSLGLQKALYEKLIADAGVLALVSTRVYDRAPQDVVFPFIQFGEIQVLEDDATCVEQFEVYFDLHVWVREVGRVKAQQIAEAVRRALHYATLGGLPNDLALVEIEHQSTRAITDPDGVTAHSIITFRAFLETA